MNTSATQKHRYPRPDISLIESDIPKWGVDIYIGGSTGLANEQLLARHHIKAVINCAVNLDINLVTEPESDIPEHLSTYGSGKVRYYKLGLVDGPGNPDVMMLAGYYLMRSILEQRLPEKPSYKNREKGNILINCRGGRSRSVTLVALFLHLECPQRYPSLSDAIAHVREKRQLHPNEWYETPKPELISIAEKAAQMAILLKEAGFDSQHEAV
ncbi:MAG: hypothetical protein CENE_03678 [Candidatus Celerinatantimonas neptuna]|nr:MAG: hypothetical protein CENE_03678 [Candidatus Celerinatantimonas neptuna]